VFARVLLFVGDAATWLGALSDTMVFALFEDCGEEDIKSVNRALGLVMGSSSSEATAGEDDGSRFRFRRFAGGAMAAKLAEKASSSVCIVVPRRNRRPSLHSAVAGALQKLVTQLAGLLG